MSGATAEGFSKACVKLYATRHDVRDDAELYVPIFHDWIREGALELVMLDVADYAHAPVSPGIMLVCHEVSFALDRSDERFGLYAQRRTPFSGSAEEAVAETIRQTLTVGTKLEQEPRVAGRLVLDASRIRVEANDRLRIPNTDEGEAVFEGVVRDAFGLLLPDPELRIERVDNDPRDRLALEVEHGDASDVGRLLAALTPGLAQGSV